MLIYVFGVGTACAQTQRKAEQDKGKAEKREPKFEVTVSEAATGKEAERLLKNAERLGEIRHQFSEQSRQCHSLLRDDKLKEAETVCLAALKLVDQLDAPTELERIGAHESVGEVMVGQQRYREALEYYSRALDLGQRSDLTETDAELGQLYGNVAMTNHLLGDLDKALEMYRKAEKISQAAYKHFGEGATDEWAVRTRQGYLKYLKTLLEYHQRAAEEAGDASEVEEVEKLRKSLP
ncbi:MAG TPA: tetratricopeptide repeat protein [Pyrinomonadaceae bacterium]